MVDYLKFIANSLVTNGKGNFDMASSTAQLGTGVLLQHLVPPNSTAMNPVTKGGSPGISQETSL